MIENTVGEHEMMSLNEKIVTRVEKLKVGLVVVGSVVIEFQTAAHGRSVDMTGLRGGKGMVGRDSVSFAQSQWLVSSWGGVGWGRQGL